MRPLCDALGDAGRPPTSERKPDAVSYSEHDQAVLSAPADGSQMRAMVARAKQFLDQGSDAAAIELFRGVIEAGYNGADARVQLAEALSSRGGTEEAATLASAVADDPIWGARARRLLTLLNGASERAPQPTSTAPAQPPESNDAADAPRSTASIPDLGKLTVTPTKDLPGDMTRTRTLTRELHEIDRDIERGRFESALDLTLHALSLAPDELGLYLRHAELLLLTGRPRDALRLSLVIQRLADLRDDRTLEVALRRVLLHAEPTRERLRNLVDLLLEQHQAEYLTEYVPVAISDLATAEDHEASYLLAKAWHEAQAGEAQATFAYVLAALGNERVEEVNSTELSGDDLWLRASRLALAAMSGDAAQWGITASMVRDAVAGKIEHTAMTRMLSEIAEALPQCAIIDLHRAIAALWFGEYVEVLRRLRGYRAQEPLSDFVAAVCLARAATALDDEATSLDALCRAYDLIEQTDEADRSAVADIFDPPATPLALGRKLAELLDRHGDAAKAGALYQRLLALNPNDADLTRHHAEALARGGQRVQALERLDALLTQQEAAGARAAALATLQSMVQIAPGNASLRRRLSDGYIQRGQITEAVAELFILAQLLERKNLVGEATTQLQRAAEIATLTGEWAKVNHIYKYMTRLQPDDIGLRHAAAATYIQHGRIDQAVEQLQEVVRIAVVAEDPDEAIAALHQIIALMPRDTDSYHKLGELLASIGEFGQAERVYRRLAGLLPDDPAVKAKQSALAALARGTV